jgi:Spy/CpxP family protein refolding chaperone
MLMTKWKKTSVILAIAGALLVMVAMVAFSQGRPDGARDGGFRGDHGRGREGGPGGSRDGRDGRDGLGPLGRDLNLTDDQKAQIKKISESFNESNKSLHEQLRTLHESEPDPLSGAFDEGAVRASAEARSKIEVELSVSRAKMMSQISTVLTADQKAQLAARRKQFGPKPPAQ